MNANQSQPDETGAQPVQAQTRKARRALSRITRELTQEDLSQAGVQKMLVEELERAEEENSDLESFREKFHSVDKDLSVSNQKLKGWKSNEIISTACIAVGAAVIVYAIEAWKTQPSGWMALVVGGILTCIGIVAKVIPL